MAVPAYPIAPRHSEEGQVKALYKMFLRPGDAHLVGPDGIPHEIPESVYKVLRCVLSTMQEGKAIVVLPMMEELTTKAAADFLGVSRQYLVRLLEKGKIDFHKTGTHRRVYLKDLIDYRKKRDTERHQAIGNLARREVDEGTYDMFVVPDAE